MKVVSKENTEAAHYIVELLKRVSIDDVPTLKRGGKLVPKDKKGGGIHIKKANRGKFTEYCNGKVTSECIAKGKKSSDPAVRKRATFAQNARRWKH